MLNRAGFEDRNGIYRLYVRCGIRRPTKTCSNSKADNFGCLLFTSKQYILWMCQRPRNTVKPCGLSRKPALPAKWGNPKFRGLTKRSFGHNIIV